MEFTFRWVPTPGQNNGFVENNNAQIRAFVDETQQDPFDSPLYMCIPPITFAGGDASTLSIYEFAKTIATCGVVTTVQNPGINYNGNRVSTGGAFTIDGYPCGTYEYNVLPGGITLNQADVATLFSNRNDISTWIVVKGDLTIGANTTLIPTVNPYYVKPYSPVYQFPPDPNALRRLFMVIYVTGNMVFADNLANISMSACGGNTSATGANIASFNVPISYDLLYYTGAQVATPYLAAVGGLGGAATDNSYGNAGSGSATDPYGNIVGTGGGGSGNKIGTDPSKLSGAGGAGSPFSGGAGGGAATDNPTILATDGSSLGGAGGNGSGDYVDAACGGTGNPGGTAQNGGTGLTGTGGVVIVICEGTIDITNGGYITAYGINGTFQENPSFTTLGGGASGGGAIVVIQSSSIISFPSGNAAGGDNLGTGGIGGNGRYFQYGITS